MSHKAILVTLVFLGSVLGSALASPALADACSGSTRSGGFLGAILGKAASRDDGGALSGGALLGGAAGNAIARDMECADRPYAVRTYHQSFRGPVGRRYGWNRGPNRGYVVTHREYHRSGRLCRDFTQVVYRKGRQFDRPGTACLRRDGEWEFV